jgi:NitT/TauT family transport system permease protein
MKHRWTDYAILVSAILLLWQVAYYFAGPEAITPPLATVERLGVLMGGARFWDHARASGIAFVYAVALALVGGLVLGIAIGARS